MSFTIDANILIFGANTAAPEHRASRQALDEAWASSEQIVLFWPVVMAYLRVVTVPGVLSRQASTEVAVDSVDRLLSLPNVQLEGDTPRGWEAFREVVLGRRPMGGLIHDAHLVALMRQHGVETIWTHDIDFTRFDGIRVYDPVTGERRG